MGVSLPTAFMVKESEGIAAIQNRMPSSQKHDGADKIRFFPCQVPVIVVVDAGSEFGVVSELSVVLLQ